MPFGTFLTDVQKFATTEVYCYIATCCSKVLTALPKYVEDLKPILSCEGPEHFCSFTLQSKSRTSPVLQAEKETVEDVLHHQFMDVGKVVQSTKGLWNLSRI